MNETELLSVINLEMSTYDIAKKFNCSQTNVRYWLRKFGLNTKNISTKSELGNHKNGRTCDCCHVELTGCKIRFCGRECKKSFYKIKNKKENLNTNLRQKEVGKSRKLELIKMSGGCCQICGYNKNYSALCFHHLNPENKSFNLDSRKLSNTNWISLVTEWEKCQLLCQNCHSEIHNPNNLI